MSAVEVSSPAAIAEEQCHDAEIAALLNEVIDEVERVVEKDSIKRSNLPKKALNRIRSIFQRKKKVVAEPVEISRSQSEQVVKKSPDTDAEIADLLNDVIDEVERLVDEDSTDRPRLPQKALKRIRSMFHRNKKVAEKPVITKSHSELEELKVETEKSGLNIQRIMNWFQKQRGKLRKNTQEGKVTEESAEECKPVENDDSELNA
ncbi:hypothetical protein QR680_003200 [Steinernema hermaphroditum]|uniref:Homeobox domain-containing protein n=1 Tax=Steinernema hermaphroditum TaxID=289476 RepID=A0AA39H5S1_9BILA|nr:hypothetical protein QR680_003200 [Steinernema hermaphroditum]